MSWIKVRAAEVRLAEKEKKEEFERKSSAATQLRISLTPFWKGLVEVLQRDVREFNLEFPERDRVIDHFDSPAADTFSIRRSAYPAVTVKAQLNNAGTAVNYSISRTPKKGVNTVEKQASFAYVFTDGVATYADTNLRTHEDVARLLLDSFFEF